jgi:asparagine synthase (glutamine-hydrolysing)
MHPSVNGLVRVGRTSKKSSSRQESQTMCGIAGVVNRSGEPVDSALLRRMAEAIDHRGPDALAVKPLGQAGFAHTRLSIIDLSGGAQPMCNEDETLWITFNGEILNFVELREELARAGHRFATRSDTEVIIHAYEEWGSDCVTRMNGQWAFALYDTRKRELFLSRDRFGIRPLYYSLAGDRFVFASEVKSLFCHPAVKRAIDLDGLDQIFTFWCTIAPRTFFEGVCQLPPGCSLLLKQNELRVLRYFQIEARDPDPRDERELADELRSLLIDAVRLRLVRSDVPVGAYLSGGLDSTIVTAIVHQLTDTPIATFSVGFEAAEFDERRFQDEAVRGLGVRKHFSTRCRDEDIGRVFPEVIRHAEQPILRTAPAPLYLLAQLVRERGYKVVLTGEGSDELLGGYDIYKEAKVRRFCARQPASRMRPLLLQRLYPYLPQLQQQPPEYLRAFFQARPEDLRNPYFSHLPRWELTSRIKHLYSDDVKEALATRDPYAAIELPSGFSEWDPFVRAQYLETGQLLPGYILSSQGDRMAMAHGIEGRFPFLDVRVAELAARLSPAAKMRALDEKYLLKRAFAELIPAAIRLRKKQPYRAPDVAPFFAEGRARFPYVSELLAAESLERVGLFHPGAVARLVDKIGRGGPIGAKDGMALVGILSTQLAVEQLLNDRGRGRFSP